MNTENAIQFPEGFLWGAASAAYQIEGASAEGGKAPSIWDNFSQLPGKTKNGTDGKVAVDHYHRFREDIQLMAKMNLKAYRFSLAWSRVLPNGEVNQEGLDFYGALIDELIANGIEPVVTLYHWDLPQALQDEYGGWESRETIQAFLKYAEVVFKEFGDRVRYWVTFNEQNVFTSLGYRWASHPPNVSDMKRMYQANHLVNLANAEVISLCHRLLPDALIGPSFGYGEVVPETCHPQDVVAAMDANLFNNDWWLEVYCRGTYPQRIMNVLKQLDLDFEVTAADMATLKAAKPDFLGINYYHGGTVRRPSATVMNEKNLEMTDPYLMAADGQKETPEHLLFQSVSNPYLAKTDWGWEIDPVGLQIALRNVYEKYQLPIFITENGLGAFDTLTSTDEIDDDYRITFYREHLLELANAIACGVPVIGYCAWSFTDLLSWLNGYEKRYGFVYVDRTDEDVRELKRIPKKSYFWYRDLIAKNGQQLTEEK
ncbi:glycoside hydrolase family 1 protein [Enterococcus diestrammenae]|uniref:glycoside hydrolase family 1 protein n=1 Tax=Enterococcus diestrammenae TaxID=1155073 RepID=UPI0022E78E4C|nr:glycoside hydrolase family 1 protein [Enterococcus diestrammenae]